MPDIFVSHSRLDRDRIRPIVERLRSLGYSVSYDTVGELAIEREFEAARSVLAAWSENARHSTIVLAQAAGAQDASKLVQLRLDRTLPPPPFHALPAADLSGDIGEWGPLEAMLADRLGDQGSAEAPTPVTTPSALGAPRLIALALTLSLLALVGILQNTLNGVLPLDQARTALLATLAVAVLCAGVSGFCLVRLTRVGG